MPRKILLPQEIMSEGRALLENAGHTIIEGRGFETEDVLADMKEYQPDAMIVRITPITRNMVNRKTLSMMKPTAFLINTARGTCVDEEALYEACTNGTIAGAGLDAIKKEPVSPDFPLLGLDNVIIYPHIGGNSTEAAHRASYFAAMGVQEVYEGKEPTWPIHDIDYATAPTYTDTKKPDTEPAGMFAY